MVRNHETCPTDGLGSISFAALLSVMAPAATSAATQHPCDNADAVRCTLGDVRIRRKATVDWPRPDNRPTTGRSARSAVRDRAHGRAAGDLRRRHGSRGSEILTPADRFATSQLVGVGYVVNPRFRFGVMGIFNEVLTGQPPAVDAWQFGGIAPIAIGTFEHVIIGGGPIIGYRSGGKRQSDVGAVVLSGASIPLGKGLALNIAAPSLRCSCVG